MSDEMSAEPVAWIVKLPKERRGFTNDVCMYYKDGEMLQGHRDAGDEIIPLYSQSPSVARALAIAECARVARDLYRGDGDRVSCAEQDYNDAITQYEEAIRALSPALSVSEEWISRRIEDAYDKTRGNNEGDALAEDSIRATLAALGVTVEGAAK